MMNLMLFVSWLVPTLGGNWAVIMAGSNTYGNYRHQADACHAYQIMKRNGIPENNIIVLAYDDIANSNENPFPGIEYNKPTAKGVAGVDVYKGCKIHYRGENVTGENFVKVLEGDASAPGPVLKSTKDDRVFVYWTDHGGVGILGVPNNAKGGFIHAKDVNAALEKATYKELLFYLEACESGSIFKGLLKAPRVFAVTAANAKESSWGFYCPPNDTVSGQHVGSCLGDLFSINWLEDADVANFKLETVQEQVDKVKKETNKSHVQQFGDRTTIPREVIGEFEGTEGSPGQAQENFEDYSNSAVNQRNIDIHLAYYALTRARSTEEMIDTQSNLEKLRMKHAREDTMFSRIALSIEPNRELALELLEGQVGSHFPQHLDCHQEALEAVTQKCGPLNDYTMHYSRLFANLCSNRVNIGKIEAAIAGACGSTPHQIVEPVIVNKSTFDFKGDEYHVLIAREMPATFFAARDLYRLTGHLETEGGKVTVQCLNNTAEHTCSHSMQFGEAYKPFPGRSPETRRKFAATVGGTAYNGYAMFYMNRCTEIVYKGEDPEQEALVLPGPNPQPRPPYVPPSKCTSAFNQTGCVHLKDPRNKTLSCVWCKSTDNIHELCFTKGHTPKKDWSCSNEEVLIV